MMLQIPEALIAREAQNHPAGEGAQAWSEAANALAIRALLLHRAAALGLSAEPEFDDQGREETIEEAFHAAPNLKVADLARRLGEPDYKVSRCITASLGFANFNQMLNAYRVARAREMLADPALRNRSILLIALDCGFGSIGPFNRAFKAAAGVTPRAFRNACPRAS